MSTAVLCVDDLIVFPDLPYFDWHSGCDYPVSIQYTDLLIYMFMYT